MLILDYVRGYDVNRLLEVFRANGGLPTLGAVTPSGWEGLDSEANGNLRGHYSGHFLSMLSQAYASSGEQAFADKISTMVGALVKRRQALNQPPSALGVQGRFPQLRLIDASARVTPHTRPSRTRHQEITCTVP